MTYLVEDRGTLPRSPRGLPTSIPIWVRVPGIIALVLVGIVVSSMLLGGSSGMDHEGGRDRGSQMGGMEHNGGQTGSAAPSEPAPSGDHTAPKEGAPSDGPGDQARSDGSRGH